MVYRGVKAQPVLRGIKAVGTGHRSGVADRGVFADQLYNPVIVIDAAFGIGHACDLSASDRFKRLLIIAYLMNDLMIIQVGQIDMIKRVYSDFVTGVYLWDCPGSEFHMAYRATAAHEMRFLSQTAGVQIEGGFETIAVKEFNQAQILRYAIIEAEG